MQEVVRKTLKKESKCKISVIICSNYIGTFHKMTGCHQKRKKVKKSTAAKLRRWQYCSLPQDYTQLFIQCSKNVLHYAVRIRIGKGAVIGAKLQRKGQ